MINGGGVAVGAARRLLEDGVVKRVPCVYDGFSARIAEQTLSAATHGQTTSKNFITSMLGALVALVIFTAGACLLFIGLVGAIVAVGQKKAPEVETGSYLVFDLSTNITDAPPPVDLSDLTNGRTDVLQLRSITRALRHAAVDVQHMAKDVACAVAAQEQDGVSNVVAIGDAAGGDARQHRLLVQASGL